jgi:hypothetical protein
MNRSLVSAFAFSVVALVSIEASAHKDVCERTSSVRDAIERNQNRPCDQINDADLQTITDLRYLDMYETSVLRDGDFDGLSKLQALNLQGQRLSRLEPNVFSGLTSLTSITIESGRLRRLPKTVFAGLTSLQNLILPGAGIESFSPGVFDGLTSLQALNITGNSPKTALPAGLFKDLKSLKWLYIDKGTFSATAPSVFAQLSSIKEISQQDDQAQEPQRSSPRSTPRKRIASAGNLFVTATSNACVYMEQMESIDSDLKTVPANISAERALCSKIVYLNEKTSKTQAQDALIKKVNAIDKAIRVYKQMKSKSNNEGYRELLDDTAKSLQHEQFEMRRAYLMFEKAIDDIAAAKVMRDAANEPEEDTGG